MRKLFLLLVLLPLVAWAQDEPPTTQTFHMPAGKVFVCSASQQPVKYFSQFTCLGIPLDDSTGKPAGQFFLFSPNEINLVLPPFVSDPYKSYTYGYPNGGLPASFTFDYVAVEFEHNNIMRRGLAHVTWKNVRICGGRGCGWWAPELTAFSITVN